MAILPLVDILYPRSCACCGTPDPAATRHLCWDCMSDILLVQPPFCARCGNPVSGFIDHDYVCSLCVADPPHFDRARSGARFDGPLREMLIAFKYRKGLWLGRDIAEIMYACFTSHYDAGEIDLVAFVPLHRRKKREREFNQSEILARILARRLRKPLSTGCLVRTRPTPTQTNLTADQRAANVRDAFSTRWRRWIDGKRILLVDDVMTTGATVSECARALKQGGAARVDVLTAARR